MILLKRESRPASPTTVAAAPAGPDLNAAIRSIAHQASNIGREAAEVRGFFDDTTKTSERSA